MAELDDPAEPLRWSCAACGAGNALPLTRRQAAFYDSEPVRREIKRRRPACSGCGASMDPRSSSLVPPSIEDDLLEEWFADKRLVFMMQDEDLVMASAPLDVLLRFANRPEQQKKRHEVVRHLLKLKLYHHARGGTGEFASSDDVELCAEWLRRHGTGSIPRYMAADLAPMLRTT